MAQHLAGLRLAFPGVAVVMNYASSGSLLKQLRQGEIDLVCCMPETFGQNASGLYAQVVDKVAMRLMVAAGHPLSQIGSVCDEDLNAVPQITYLGVGRVDSFKWERVAQEHIALNSFELV